MTEAIYKIDMSDVTPRVLEMTGTIIDAINKHSGNARPYYHGSEIIEALVLATLRMAIIEERNR